jgi:hypothetical protein
VQVEILFCGRGKAINAACCAALNSYRFGNRPDAILAQLGFLGRELESPDIRMKGESARDSSSRLHR